MAGDIWDQLQTRLDLARRRTNTIVSDYHRQQAALNELDNLREVIEQLREAEAERDVSVKSVVEHINRDGTPSVMPSLADVIAKIPRR